MSGTNALSIMLAVLLMAVSTPSGQPLPKQPGDYTPAAPSSVVSWNMKRLAPPSPLYVGVDDQLRVSVATSQTGEVVTIGYRLLRAADGKIVAGSFVVTPTPLNFPPPAVTQQLAEGFLLSISCQAKVALNRGQTFVRVALAPASLGSSVAAQQLMSDYVTTQQAPAFPNGRILSSVEGPGWVHAVQQNTPGAGFDWGENFGSTVRRRLIGARAQLQTSAVVQNRLAQMVVLDNLLNGVMVFTGAALQTASQTWNYTWSAAPILPTSLGVQPQVPLPPELILPVGYTVEVVTGGLDSNHVTGDQWSGIFLYYEEWLDNV